MTTQDKDKNAPTIEKQAVPEADLQAAYEIHTLAQALYGRLTLANPWVTPYPPMANFEMPTAWNVPPVASPPWHTPTDWAW